MYRIFLSRTIGSEGLGVYQIALTVFGLMLTLTSSAIPITVSRLMTRYKSEKNNALAYSAISSGVLFSLLISTPIIFIFFAFKNNLGFIFSDDRCMPILLIILPGLAITSVYAVIRGSFWGNKDFLPYSIIELAEEIVMALCGIILISLSSTQQNKLTAAAFAVLISYIFSFTTATIVFFLRKGKLSNPSKTLKPLISSAIPITGMRTVSSLVNSLIAVILPIRLISSGMSKQGALSSFGAAYGMATPLLFMPSTLIGSLSVVLVPELSENFYKGERQKLSANIEKSLKFSVFISSVIIPVLFSFGKNLGVFFYNSQEAGLYLSFSSATVLPMSLSMITTSMLNSLNSEKHTLAIYVCGACFMLLSVFILPPFIGIYSLAVGLFGQFLISAVLNLFFLKKKTAINIDYIVFTAKSLIIISVSSFFGLTLNNVLSAILPVWATCLLGCLLTAAFSCTPFTILSKNATAKMQSN